MLAILYCIWYSIDVQEGISSFQKKKNKLTKEKLEMEEIITYEIGNGNKFKVKTYASGSVKKFDKNGNEIYHKCPDGFEEWHEYNANGRVIHSWNTDGYEQWYEYDSTGNEIHYKSNRGFEQWYEYDTNGNMIHFKDTDGVEK